MGDLESVLVSFCCYIGGCLVSERGMFTFELVLTEKEGFDPPLRMAVDLDASVIDGGMHIPKPLEMELGMASMSDVVEVIQRKHIRKDLFIRAAKNLAASMAERMEDAEGWHDERRVEPARKSLGYRS